MSTSPQPIPSGTPPRPNSAARPAQGPPRPSSGQHPSRPTSAALLSPNSGRPASAQSNASVVSEPFVGGTPRVGRTRSPNQVNFSSTDSPGLVRATPRSSSAGSQGSMSPARRRASSAARVHARTQRIWAQGQNEMIRDTVTGRKVIEFDEARARARLAEAKGHGILTALLFNKQRRKHAALVQMEADARVLLDKAAQHLSDMAGTVALDIEERHARRAIRQHHARFRYTIAAECAFSGALTVPRYTEASAMFAAFREGWWALSVAELRRAEAKGRPVIVREAFEAFDAAHDAAVAEGGALSRHLERTAIEHREADVRRGILDSQWVEVLDATAPMMDERHQVERNDLTVAEEEVRHMHCDNYGLQHTAWFRDGYCGDLEEYIRRLFEEEALTALAHIGAAHLFFTRSNALIAQEVFLRQKLEGREVLDSDGVSLSSPDDASVFVGTPSDAVVDALTPDVSAIAPASILEGSTPLIQSPVAAAHHHAGAVHHRTSVTELQGRSVLESLFHAQRLLIVKKVAARMIQKVARAGARRERLGVRRVIYRNEQARDIALLIRVMTAARDSAALVQQRRDEWIASSVGVEVATAASVRLTTELWRAKYAGAISRMQRCGRGFLIRSTLGLYKAEAADAAEAEHWRRTIAALKVQWLWRAFHARRTAQRRREQRALDAAAGRRLAPVQAFLRALHSAHVASLRRVAGADSAALFLQSIGRAVAARQEMRVLRATAMVQRRLRAHLSSLLMLSKKWHAPVCTIQRTARRMIASTRQKSAVARRDAYVQFRLSDAAAQDVQRAWHGFKARRRCRRLGEVKRFAAEHFRQLQHAAATALIRRCVFGALGRATVGKTRIIKKRSEELIVAVLVAHRLQEQSVDLVGKLRIAALPPPPPSPASVSTAVVTHLRVMLSAATTNALAALRMAANVAAAETIQRVCRGGVDRWECRVVTAERKGAIVRAQSAWRQHRARSRSSMRRAEVTAERAIRRRSRAVALLVKWWRIAWCARNDAARPLQRAFLTRRGQLLTKLDARDNARGIAECGRRQTMRSEALARIAAVRSENEEWTVIHAAAKAELSDARRSMAIGGAFLQDDHGFASMGAALEVKEAHRRNKIALAAIGELRDAIIPVFIASRKNATALTEARVTAEAQQRVDGVLRDEATLRRRIEIRRATAWREAIMAHHRSLVAEHYEGRIERDVIGLELGTRLIIQKEYFAWARQDAADAACRIHAMADAQATQRRAAQRAAEDQERLLRVEVAAAPATLGRGTLPIVGPLRAFAKRHAPAMDAVDDDTLTSQHLKAILLSAGSEPDIDPLAIEAPVPAAAVPEVRPKSAQELLEDANMEARRPLSTDESARLTSAGQPLRPRSRGQTPLSSRRSPSAERATKVQGSPSQLPPLASSYGHKSPRRDTKAVGKQKGAQAGLRSAKARALLDGARPPGLPEFVRRVPSAVRQAVLEPAVLRTLKTNADGVLICDGTGEPRPSTSDASSAPGTRSGLRTASAAAGNDARLALRSADRTGGRLTTIVAPEDVFPPAPGSAALRPDLASSFGSMASVPLTSLETIPITSARLPPVGTSLLAALASSDSAVPPRGLGSHATGTTTPSGDKESPAGAGTGETGQGGERKASAVLKHELAVLQKEAEEERAAREPPAPKTPPPPPIVDDRYVPAICDMLTRPPMCKTLVVGAARITDDGLLAIVDEIERGGAPVETIDLSRAPALTDVAALHIAHRVKRLPYLRHVEFAGTKIATSKRQLVAHLLAARPGAVPGSPPVAKVPRRASAPAVTDTAHVPMLTDTDGDVAAAPPATAEGRAVREHPLVPFPEQRRPFVQMPRRGYGMTTTAPELPPITAKHRERALRSLRTLDD